MGRERILCYGDSLTWGIVPGTRERHNPGNRWPFVLAQLTKKHVIEAALNGRTTAYDFPGRPQRNGLQTLPLMLEQNAPLDHVVIMLGTNDFLALASPKSEQVVWGIQQLCTLVREYQFKPGIAVPAVTLVSPPLPRMISNHAYPFAKISPDIEQEARRLPALIGQYALSQHIPLFDASMFLTDDRDGIHLSAQTNRELGATLASFILSTSY